MLEHNRQEGNADYIGPQGQPIDAEPSGFTKDEFKIENGPSLLDVASFSGQGEPELSESAHLARIEENPAGSLAETKTCSHCRANHLESWGGCKGEGLPPDQAASFRLPLREISEWRLTSPILPVGGVNPEFTSFNSSWDCYCPCDEQDIPDGECELDEGEDHEFDPYPEPTGEPIAFFPRGRKNACSGFYISYNPTAHNNAVDTLLQVMKECGIESEKNDVTSCRCCRTNAGQCAKITIKKGAKIADEMTRIARMIQSSKRGFCIDINLKIGKIDSYGNVAGESVRANAQMDPNLFRDVKNVNFGSLPQSFNRDRSKCQLLAHVLGESWHGLNFMPPALSESDAHLWALAEENWVRYKGGEKNLIAVEKQGERRQRVFEGMLKKLKIPFKWDKGTFVPR